VGKDVQPLQSVKPIRIIVSTVLDESWCGHKTSVWVWDVSMVWYSDEALEAFAIVVWSLAFVFVGAESSPDTN
jgi:hypothetical protein